jgi:6-phospho-3-hexuloisomerase
MSISRYLAAILAELVENQREVHDDQCVLLVQDIATARHVFVAGAGRSGLAVGAFANRLAHLGKSTSLVGDVTSPHTRPGDMLLVASGSGETPGLLAIARRARDAHTRIGLVTLDDQSSIALMSDVVVVLPGASPKVRSQSGRTSIQPMGSAFEQMSGLLYDAMVLELMARLGETSESMFARHANLE